VPPSFSGRRFEVNHHRADLGQWSLGSSGPALPVCHARSAQCRPKRLHNLVLTEYRGHQPGSLATSLLIERRVRMQAQDNRRQSRRSIGNQLRQDTAQRQTFSRDWGHRAR
jgi:hypothetical protein